MPMSRDKVRVRPRRLVIVGDSLAACCPWSRLSWLPFATLNLACGGARLRDVERQLRDAPRASSTMADGGLNDLLGAGRSPLEIHHDFLALLDGLARRPRAVFTLMPHVADPHWTADIDAANALMSESCRSAGVAILDLNPLLSQNGVRRPEMTNDGLHFTPRANREWLAAMRQILR